MVELESRIWTLKKSVVTSYIQKLTKYRKWLLVLVCPYSLINIVNIVVILNHYVPYNGYWLLGLYINKLLLKWMPCVI